MFILLILAACYVILKFQIDVFMCVYYVEQGWWVWRKEVCYLKITTLAEHIDRKPFSSAKFSC